MKIKIKNDVYEIAKRIKEILEQKMLISIENLFPEIEENKNTPETYRSEMRG